MQMQALHNKYEFYTLFSKIYSTVYKNASEIDTLLSCTFETAQNQLFLWVLHEWYFNPGSPRHILTKKNTARRCNTQGCCNFYISKHILTAEPKWVQTEINCAPFLKTSQTKFFCLKNVNDILTLAAQDSFKHIEKPQAAATVSDSAILTFIWTNLIFVYKIYIS